MRLYLLTKDKSSILNIYIMRGHISLKCSNHKFKLFNFIPIFSNPVFFYKCVKFTVTSCSLSHYLIDSLTKLLAV